MLAATPAPGTILPEAATSMPVYQEVWFIVVVAILALLFLFIGIALCLRCTGHRMPYIRERNPLPQRQKQPLGYYDGSIITTVSHR